MTLIDTLKEKLAQNDLDSVLRTMGYRNLEHAQKRLQSLLESPNIESWLKKSSFDFHYSSKEFLRKLFEVLSLPLQPLEEELARIDEKTVALAKMQQPYIFVDTNFHRANQPIFALAMLEGRRHIGIDKEMLYKKSLDEVLKIVSAIIQEHYKQTKGELFMWGKIQRYVYHHSDGRVFVFDTKGNLIPNPEKVEENRAILSVNGRTIPLVFEENNHSKTP
ncbi:hypothetical protein NitYY0826_C1789 [Nitratiruptor sp. YY08-26]|uniref:hypothetical protein n=1 Tax=unclassified Nitratiruptor TaxID=2624044 RepID=UPI0019152543|nr:MULTISPECIES: hypothetical protein [unclassified Nitratiruptor]BCD62901.1 hypothetical protein NitYY0813_C1787 [Nitratiruptor sp. YY08-13]BCD66836.1 hypothetical protein NitYY0826_C1789 [Nitratiruptor sp. YY08-26]